MVVNLLLVLQTYYLTFFLIMISAFLVVLVLVLLHYLVYLMHYFVLLVVVLFVLFQVYWNLIDEEDENEELANISVCVPLSGLSFILINQHHPTRYLVAFFLPFLVTSLVYVFLLLSQFPQKWGVISTYVII